MTIKPQRKLTTVIVVVLSSWWMWIFWCMLVWSWESGASTSASSASSILWLLARIVPPTALVPARRCLSRLWVFKWRFISERTRNGLSHTSQRCGFSPGEIDQNRKTIYKNVKDICTDLRKWVWNGRNSTCMYPSVVLKVGWSSELLLTEFTNVVFLSCMNASMNNEWVFSSKVLSTVFTLVLFFFRMAWCTMVFQISPLAEVATTEFTFVRFITRVQTHVNLQFQFNKTVRHK